MALTGDLSGMANMDGVLGVAGGPWRVLGISGWCSGCRIMKRRAVGDELV